MTSQISTHKLIRLELKQNSWILAINTLLHVLCGPVLFLLSSSDDVISTTRKVRLYAAFFADNYCVFQIMVIILCISLDIYLYRYVFFKRMADLYHSTPISRKQLFFAKYMTGFLLWCIPFLANLFCVALFSLVNLGDIFLYGAVLNKLLQSVGIIFLCFFIFYHLFLTAVGLSGNILNMFVNVAVIGFSAYTLFYLLVNCAQTYFETYYYQIPTSLNDSILSLSPFISPFGLWIYLSRGDLRQHWLLLLLSVFLMLFMGYLSYRLYEKRPSELAERGTVAKVYTMLSRILVSILMGIGGAIFFGSIAPNHEIIWHIFGTLLCAPLAFGLLSCTYQTSIKAIFHHKILLALTTLASTFIVLSFQQDWFGYDNYMPDMEQIAGLTISPSNPKLGDGSTQLYLTDNNQLAYTDDSLQIPAPPYTDALTCANLLSEFINNQPSINGLSNYYVRVNLNNGKSYSRYYSLSDEKAGMLAPFIETDNYKNTHYKFSTGALGYPQDMRIRLSNGNTIAVSKDNINRLMNAYIKDFEENYCFESLTDYLYVATLRGEYPIYDTDGSFYLKYSSLPVKSNYKNTLAVLREMDTYNMFLADKPEWVRNINFYFEVSSTDNMESLRNYFNYGPHSNYSTIVYDVETNDPPSTQGIALAETIVSASCLLTDEALLAELLPYLYFGDYENLYSESTDYIYIGEAQIHENMVVSVYKKPGELPEKFYEYISNFMVIHS